MHSDANYNDVVHNNNNETTIIACYKVLEHKGIHAVVSNLRRHCWKAFLFYDRSSHLVYFDERYKLESFVAYNRECGHSLHDMDGPIEHKTTFTATHMLSPVECCILHSIMNRWKHFWHFIIQIVQ